MFVSIGFDDNAISGIPGSANAGEGMTWILDHLRHMNNPPGSGNASTYDAAPVRVTFFNSSEYQDSWRIENPEYVRQAWIQAMNDGHETGNHTSSHPHGNGGSGDSPFGFQDWHNEISKTQRSLSEGMNIDINRLTGFRTPFLEYNEHTFWALMENGLTYDASIEEGWQPEMDGTNYPWPYTLDNGSPGDALMVSWGFPHKNKKISSYTGLWELGVTPLIIPVEDRESIKQRMPWLDSDSGKITAFDWNLWVGAARMTKKETLATLINTLELRLAGNRAPLMLGAHTGNFTSQRAMSQISVIERQEVIEEFIEYALSHPDVRIVPFDAIINWMRNPTALASPDFGDDPWEKILTVSDNLIVLEEQTWNLDWDLFQGVTSGQQAQDETAAAIGRIAEACWNGDPTLAIARLNSVLSSLDQKMYNNPERDAIKRTIESQIPLLSSLENELF